MVRQAPPSMRADDVRRDMRDQNRKREAVYDSVLGFIHKAILKQAAVGGLRLRYEIPFIVVGKPVIKVDDCVRYILSSLQGDGYTVRFTFPKSVYVSWDSNDKRAYPKLSPLEIGAISDKVKQIVYYRRAPSRHVPLEPGTGTGSPTNDASRVAVSTTEPPRNDSRAFATPTPSRTPRPVQDLGIPTRANTRHEYPVSRSRPVLPWEAFESTQPLRNQPLSLLPPPRMTVTHMCEIPRDPAAPIPNFSPTPAFGWGGCSEETSEKGPMHKPAPRVVTRDASISVERIGPKGGLVVNL